MFDILKIKSLYYRKSYKPQYQFIKIKNLKTMKRPILFTVITFLFFTSLTLFAYNIVEVLIPMGKEIIEGKGFLTTETTLMQPEGSTPVDVSGMFNERGFYKSGSVTYDENEIINDFNGNLMYSFPLFSKKGPGDLYLDLSLNYNGAVNYQVFAANAFWASSSVMPRYNLTAPGWIFSINGMAVQMLNFETNFFTKPATYSQDTIYNNEIRLLATGYHITDRLKPASDVSDNKDKIMIMRGDGSVITLERIRPPGTDCGTGEGCYIGDYYSDNKGDYTRARVEYMEYGPQPGYRNRRVSVMKGDGLTYIYEEYKNEYKDFGRNIGSQAFRPQVLLLKEIKDRFGHTLSLSYIYQIQSFNYSGQIYGRPLFSSIGGGWAGSGISFQYFPFSSILGMVYINNSGRGAYKLTCDGIDFAYQGNHRPFPINLENPAEDIISFGFEEYERIATGLKNPYSGMNGAPTTMSIKFFNTGTDVDVLRRLNNVINYNGGKRIYSYLYGDHQLSIIMNPGGNDKIQSVDPYYYGQGRDLFYNNMLDEVKTYDVDKHIKTEKFSYEYIDNGYPSLTHPVDASDEYYSTRTIESIETEFNYNTPGKLKTEKFYRNYPIFDPSVNPINPDFPGRTKILWEEFYENDEIDPYKKITYHFKLEQSGPLYTCSFLDTNITENIKGVDRIRSFRYIHDTIPLFGINRRSDNPIIQITAYDPFRIKTVNNYLIFYDSLNAHFYNARYYPKKSIEDQQGDTTAFYLIDQLYSTESFYQENNRIYKETYDYFMENTSEEGYIGQVKNKKVYNSINITDYKQIEYKYYITDSLGVELYPTDGTKPSTEGNLKEIIDPKGNITKYYYHPVDTTAYGDAPIQPKITYRKLFYDGTVDSVKLSWEDMRFPTITENIPNGEVSLYSFKKYYPSGDVWMDLSHYQYLTQFTYDGLDRLKTAILPYDFDASQVDTLRFYDTTYIPIEYTIGSESWGHYYKEGGSSYSLSGEDDTLIAGTFTLDIFREGGMPDGPNDYAKLALMTFNKKDTILSNLTEISYALFEYYPTYLETILNNDTSTNDLYLQIQAYKHIDVKHGFDLRPGAGRGNYDIPGLIVKDDNCDNFIYGYPNYYQAIDITDMLRHHLITANDSLAGLSLNIITREYQPPNPQEKYEIYLSQCLTSTFANGMMARHWKYHYSPRIKIGATYMHIDSTIIINYNKATLRYVYDDLNNKTRIYSALDNNTDKETEHLFDGFYRVKQSRLYTSLFDFDSTSVKYNYLDLQAKTKDGRGNESKFSYDEFLNLKETENADASKTHVQNFYLDGFYTSFGHVPGLVNLQKFIDEEGNNFEKYFDAVGNLIRETKKVYGAPTEGEILEIVTVHTDYRYDSLYRVTHVKTPAGKIISYSYDGYGRQRQRTTPDAGTVKYKYDKNDNLRFSQDANQDASSSDLVTFRGYDGINRLLYIGEAPIGGGVPNGGWYSLNPDGVASFENYSQYPDYFLTVNVYDTLSTAFMNEFSPPGDYGTNNFTKGNLVATAYRTRGTDNWNYKYYRYDVRGRIIKMWHVIDYLETKTIDYTYNSQNQVTYLSYQYGVEEEFKKFRYIYDKAGRLKDVNILVPIPMEDYENFTSYEYNQNSQVLKHSFNDEMIYTNYSYNNRNWIESALDNENMFRYYLKYYKNGNVDSQAIWGDYHNNFSGISDLRIIYTYDPSNRLLKAQTDYSNFSFNVENSYDYDGNLKTLKRYGSKGNVLDNFNYEYIAGTNKLLKVSGTSDQFTYDLNGNMMSDGLQDNYGLKYDHRNLLTEISRLISENETELTRYYYDEAGNRIRKLILRNWSGGGGIPDPPVWGDIGNLPIYQPEGEGGDGWSIYKNEYYVRGVGGNTIAEYDWETLQQWNVYGTDNVGKITKDGEEENKYYYLKDHLGSIRAVIDEYNNCVSAQDYDAWGYLLENRTFDTEREKYKFTGKERDDESSYDYFGARYYVSRIGRWGSVEPLMNKYVGVTPYCYALNNSIVIYDPTGEDVRATSLESQEMILNTVPQDLRGNIVFDEQGYIDKSIVNLAENTTSGNYEALRQLVNDSRLFDVMIADKFSYSDESGKIQPHEMGTIEYTDNPSPMSPRTGEIGHLGQTLFPGRQENTFNSPGDYIGIVVNEGLSSEGRAQVFSHESYGHAYLYSLGIDWSHNWVNVGEMEFVEMNKVLLNQIENSIEETIINMEDQ